MLAWRHGDHDGHQLAAEVERDLVHFKVVVCWKPMNLLVLENRAVEHILKSGLEMAVEKRQLHYSLIIIWGDIAVLLEDNTVHRERARLVSAKDIHRAQVLDRIEPLDDDLLARHQHGALGEADADYHRKHFRREADRDGQREQECFAPVMLAEAVDEKNQGHHDSHEPNHEPSKTGYALVETGWRRPLRDGASHSPEISVQTGLDDNGGCRTAFNASTQETDAFKFQRHLRCGRLGGIKLLNRQRLPSETGLGQEQVFTGQDADVGGDHVAGGKLDDVSRDQFGQWNFPFFFVADDSGRDMDHRLELGGRRIGAGLLQEPQ